jgi:hypothetical protein
MEKHVNFTLPESLNEQDVDDIRNELKGIDEVEDAGSGDARFIDAASIMVWVTLFSSVVVSIDKAIPVFEKIKGLFQKKGIKGVKISKPDGTTISVDDASAEEIVKLLKEDE